MACRGVHFAITDEDLQALRDAGSDDRVIEIVLEEIEERWEKDQGFVCETDKAWDAIHRCLTDGKLEFENGREPLKLCVLGGEPLYFGDDYIVALVTNERLRPVADGLAEVTPELMGERYALLPSDYATERSQQDLQYTWDWFCDLPAFFDQAEKAGRHVLFTVNQ